MSMSPLEASISEALPDQTLVAKIEWEFFKYGHCPVSKSFNALQLQEYYLKQNIKILALPTSHKSP